MQVPSLVRALTMSATLCAFGACGKEIDTTSNTFIDPPDAGETTAEPSADAASATPQEWACLAHPTLPVERAAGTVTYVVPIVDFDSRVVSPSSVVGLTIAVCDLPGCNGTPSVAIAQAPGQPAYVYAITFPFGFVNGFLHLEAPGYVALDYFFGGPMIGTPDGGYVVKGLVISMLTRARYAALHADLGLRSPDPTTGTFALRTLNCAGARAANVRVEALLPDPIGVAWSLSFGNIATASSLTDQRGVAGFAQVPPGTYLLEGVAPVGGPEGTPYGRTALRTIPDVITLVEIRDGLDRWGQ